MIKEQQRWLVCGGRNFARMPENQNPNKPLKSGGYSLCDWDHPEIDARNAERLFIYQTLDNLCRGRGLYHEHKDGNWLPDNLIVISGAAKGVDSVAVDWAVINWLIFEEFPADWEKYGKRAGFIRNQQMLDEGKPDLVVAFPGGKGTAMMVDIAKKAGVETLEIEYKDES